MQNTFDVTGRVVKDGEVRVTKGENKVLVFSIAENVYFGGQEQDPNFWDCEVWNGAADHFQNLVQKGQLVRVVGSLRQETFQPKDSDKTVRVNKVAVREIVGFQGFTAWKNTSGTDEPTA